MQINVNVTFQENPYDVIQRYTRTLSWGCQVNIRKISAAVKVDTGISYLLRRITDLLCFMVALTLFLLLIIAKQQEQVIFKSVQRLRSWSLAEQPPVCKGCNCGYGPSCPINTAVHPVLNTESLADGHHLSPSSPEFAIWKQKKPRVIFQTIYGSCSPDSNLLTVLKKTKSLTWFFFPQFQSPDFSSQVDACFCWLTASDSSFFFQLLTSLSHFQSSCPTTDIPHIGHLAMWLHHLGFILISATNW